MVTLLGEGAEDVTAPGDQDLAEAASSSVLRRKLLPARPPREAGTGAVEGLLKKTMPRDADELLGLQVDVVSVALGRSDKAALIADLGEHDLIFAMTGKGGIAGLCILDAGLVAALIEVQMSGRVTKAPVPERRPTRTDGIVVSDIIDRWISSAVETAEEDGLGESVPFVGYGRAEEILDLRNADLALDPGSFRTLAANLALGGGAKSGLLRFAIPLGVAAGRQGAGLADGPALMRRHMRDAPAAMHVVLARVNETFGRVGRFAVGDVIPVPITALQAVRLEGRPGDLIATGRLGQVNGQKAVRLAGPANEVHPASVKQGAPVFAGAALADLTEGAADGMAALEAPDAGGPGALPDLPELPDLPDLDDLPDLPEIDIPD